MSNDKNTVIVDERSQIGGIERSVFDKGEVEVLAEWLRNVLNEFEACEQEGYEGGHVVEVRVINKKIDNGHITKWDVGYADLFTMGFFAHWYGTSLCNLIENMGNEGYSEGMDEEEWDEENWK